MVFPKRKVGAIIVAMALALGLSPSFWSGSATSGQDSTGVPAEYYWQIVEWHVNGTPIPYIIPTFYSMEDYWNYYLEYVIYYGF